VPSLAERVDSSGHVQYIKNVLLRRARQQWARFDFRAFRQ
jgi:hypothetical protein